jgi:hypothetical protein
MRVLKIGIAKLTLGLGDTVRVTKDLTNPAFSSVLPLCVSFVAVLTGREWRPSLQAWRSARRPAREWS